MAAPLPASEAYRLWAPTYEESGALAALDEAARARLDPEPASPLLDAACGTGRRLREAAGGFRRGGFGIDAVLEMLLSGGAVGPFAAADLLALPFPAESFRTAWCRLAVGHVADLVAAYAELSRVLSPGGLLLVTDFHPDAARRGLVRSFRAAGTTVVVEHHVHEIDEHRKVAERSGLGPEGTVELAAGEEVRPFFEAAGALDAYERQRDLPVLFAVSFRKGRRERTG